MKRIWFVGALVAAIALTAASYAMSSQQPHQQPYAGLHARTVKALSAEQIADLKAGRGMGMALPAELNGYPGPVHVLEQADPLQLTGAQRAAMQKLLNAMTAEAVPLGERLIVQESELDRQFADRTVTEASLAAATQAIAATQGALRATHLRYHLETVKVLRPGQVRRYDELRGYAGGAHDPSQHGGHRH